MPSLKQHQKLFIVQHLACYFSISEVRELVKEQWRIEVPANQLARYNPLTLAGKALSVDLKAEFERAREEFVSDRSTIAIAQTNFRLRELDTLFRKIKGAKAVNTVLALSILEQAAQDEGGKYTNRREISGPNGKAIEFTSIFAGLSDEEIDERLASAEGRKAPKAVPNRS